MIKSFSGLVIAGFVLASGSAYAQDTAGADQTAADQPATEATAAQTQDGAITEDNPMGLAMGTDIADEKAPGTTYSRGTYGDWTVRCIRVKEGEKEPCQLYQLLKDSTGNRIAEFNIFNLPKGQQAAAGATIVTPLETLLTKQLTLSVDGGPNKRYPFSWCSVTGCFSRIGFSNSDLAAFKRGASAKIGIVPIVAPDQTISVAVSLTGFTKGFEAVTEANK